MVTQADQGSGDDDVGRARAAAQTLVHTLCLGKVNTDGAGPGAGSGWEQDRELDQDGSRTGSGIRMGAGPRVGSGWEQDREQDRSGTGSKTGIRGRAPGGSGCVCREHQDMAPWGGRRRAPAAA